MDISIRVWSVAEEKMYYPTDGLPPYLNITNLKFEDNDHHKFMMASGLVDIKGKLIFEDDYLKNSVGNLFIVKRLSNTQGFYAYSKYNNSNIAKLNRVARYSLVIGNTYQNAHPIKKQNINLTLPPHQ